MTCRARHLVVLLLPIVLSVVACSRTVEHVERLSSVRQVRGWNKGALVLADGKLVPLPGVSELPDKSEALAQATKHGVEIDPEGRVIGLVAIHHWCGNDPVRRHLARVDLAYMLMFLGQGRFDLPPAVRDKAPDARGEGRFSEYGWNVTEFLQFQDWSARLRAGALESLAPVE